MEWFLKIGQRHRHGAFPTHAPAADGQREVSSGALPHTSIAYETQLVGDGDRMYCTIITIDTIDKSGLRRA
jgi:hypothetical protein